MSDLVRFGVAMDRALLADFDRRITAQGYENRSEALRDLVRADLTRAALDEGAEVAATLTLVYEPEVRELVLRISELEERRAGSGGLQPAGPPRRGPAAPGDGAEGPRAGAVRARRAARRGQGVLSCALTPAAALPGAARR